VGKILRAESCVSRWKSADGLCGCRSSSLLGFILLNKHYGTSLASCSTPRATASTGMTACFPTIRSRRRRGSCWTRYRGSGNAGSAAGFPPWKPIPPVEREGEDFSGACRSAGRLCGSALTPSSSQMLADDAEAGAEDEKEVEELKKQGINPLPKPPPGVGLLPTPPRPPGPPAPTSPNGRPIPGGPPPPPPPPLPPPGPQMPPPMHEPLSPQQLQQQQDMYKKIPSLFEIVVRPTGQLAEKLGVR